MGLLPVAVEVVRNHIVAHSVDATLCRQYVSRIVEENAKLPKDMTISFPTCASLAKHSCPNQRKEFYYQSFLEAINDGAVITDSSGRPITPHSPDLPAVSSSPKPGTSAPLVR